jgi:hypothetical protein
MKSVAFLLGLINGYKTYASVILAIVTGLGMILTKNYSEGASEIFQALTLVFGGAGVAGLRHAVAKGSGPREVGLQHAVADGVGGNGAVE